MQFAVVDIETTGGYAAANGITEIAVFVTDGTAISDTFYALLNPRVPIPSFIESLTGITNARVADQPAFEDVAEELYAVLQGKIFVAHNVNFDYSFVNYHLAKCGLQLDSRKLCTIRLGRRVIPGLRGYGLDKICHHLKIPIQQRHSASGDALATTELLHILISKGARAHIEEMLRPAGGEMSLPPNLAAEEIQQLPQKPGVYYFHEKSGKVIYVGKAKNIRKRVRSHFTNNKPGRQKQEFIKNIYRITFQETATELMALVLEGVEIKKRWPEQNRSQKRFEQVYGLYTYMDANGYRRLFVEKRLRHTQPVYAFNYLSEGYALLRKLIRGYALCPHLCFLTREKSCSRDADQCGGACAGTESSAVYNQKVDKALTELTANLPTFAVFDKGMKPDEKSCILVENGRFVAMGYVSSDTCREVKNLKPELTEYADNAYVRSMIFKYAEKFPYKTLSFSGMSFSR